MTDHVLHMNTATADDWNGVPFPARQQLGDPDALRHKFPLAGPQELGSPEQGGHGMLQVAQRIRLEEPTLSPSDQEPGEGMSGGLQREVPGRNARSISGSQSSSTGQVPAAEVTTSESAAASATEALRVPEGSVQDVVDWIGDDPTRARAAIEVENQRQTPRRSLLSQLNEKIR